ncbi:MAG TPA: hypothetical protein VM491_16190 [Burkholderiaceae bacterium]|nr:hypothetical protein [Burkholderiaceae bacterium]
MAGAGHWTDPIGPGGGGAHGPDACAGDRAAWAIYGRNGTAIDSLGLLCRRGVHGLNVEPVAGPETVVAPVTAGEGSRWLSKLQPGAGFHVWTDTPSDCPIGMTGNGIEVPRTAYADAAAPLCSAR